MCGTALHCTAVNTNTQSPRESYVRSKKNAWKIKIKCNENNFNAKINMKMWIKSAFTGQQSIARYDCATERRITARRHHVGEHSMLKQLHAASATAAAAASEHIDLGSRDTRGMTWRSWGGLGLDGLQTQLTRLRYTQSRQFYSYHWWWFYIQQWERRATLPYPFNAVRCHQYGKPF